jgi:hypothetical protein
VAAEALQNTIKFRRQGFEHGNSYLVKKINDLDGQVYWNRAGAVKAIAGPAGPENRQLSSREVILGQTHPD